MGSSHYQSCTVINKSQGSFNPVVYGVIKKCASDIFKIIAYKNNMCCNIIIFPNVFGANDKPNTAIVFFIKRLLANEPLNLISGDYPDDWVYIDDLVDGIIRAAKSDKEYAEYFIGHRNITTFKKKLTAIKTMLSSKSELLFGTYPEISRVDYDQFDLDALYRDTGFEIETDFADSIRKTAECVKILR